MAEALRSRHLDVWYDEFSLTVGDGLREAIDRGLASSRFGIVVLSPSFFQKGWPKRELSGLVAREIAEDRRLVLPIWHHIDKDEVIKHSPPLADVVAISSNQGLDSVVNSLLRRLRPEESPLIIARDFLIGKGVPPPVITDEWWLDIIEIKESQLRFPDGTRRWIFPLPFPENDYGRERGLNIAWTALQMDWVNDAEERNICQLTAPSQVHEFLRKWPGLLECARANPGVLAMYAPQLTIRGFDDGLMDVFDDLLDPARTDAYEMIGYDGFRPTTTGEDPLCGELIAWRHTSFGNYTPSGLAWSFVHAHDSHYSRYLFDSFKCLTWLLSDDANWMPSRLREILFEGFRLGHSWFDHIGSASNPFIGALFHNSRSQFRTTGRVKAGLLELISKALKEIGSLEEARPIVDRFLSRGFIDGFYAREEELRVKRRR